MRLRHIVGFALIAASPAACGESESNDETSNGGKGGSTTSGGTSPVGGAGAGRGGSSGANSGGSDRGGSAGSNNPTGGSSGSSGAGGSSEGGAGAGGDSPGGAGGDGPGGSGTCMPITSDASAVGMSCASNACPTGYTCQDYVGAIFQQQCAILCENDCECPTDLSCAVFTDKVSTWTECRRQ